MTSTQPVGVLITWLLKVVDRSDGERLSSVVQELELSLNEAASTVFTTAYHHRP